jgi:hypothetical protein
MRGAYLVNVAEENGQPAPVSGAVNSYSPEFNIIGSDRDLLASISEATGGQAMPEPSTSDVNLFERRATKTRPHEIWEALMLAALLLLPVDVGIRRVHITREQLENARGWASAKLRRQRAAELEAETPVSLAQLKDARARVRLGDAEIISKDVEAEAQEAASATSGLAEQRKRDGARLDRAQVKGSLKAEAPAAEAEQAEPLASRLLDARRKRRD